MESFNTASEMLELISAPAFCVKDGVIVCVNQAAQQLLIESNTPVSTLLTTGEEEYAGFTGGSMYLTLTLSGITYGTSVTEKAGLHVFVLEESTEAALQALALAAIELRKPLSGIMSEFESLLRSLAQDNRPDVQEQASRLNRGLYRMLRVIGNMSDASRYTSAGSFHPEIRNISAILGELFRQAEHLVEQSGTQFRFRVPAQDIYCPVDKEFLERSVLNLISNALNHTPIGGWIECSASLKGNKLSLTVSNSGDPVPPAILGSIFTRYLRTPALSDADQGIGLGMVLVCAAARAHGGTVLIEQPQGQGPRITMTLSLAIPKDHTLRSPVLSVDYAGERPHALIELSDSLASEHYEISNSH